MDKTIYIAKFKKDIEKMSSCLKEIAEKNCKVILTVASKEDAETMKFLKESFENEKELYMFGDIICKESDFEYIKIVKTKV